MTAKLNVRIDRLANFRIAHRASDTNLGAPSLSAAAFICEVAGADAVTLRLCGDLFDIPSAELQAIRNNLTIYLNVEMTATEEMVRTAFDAQPDAVTLVPESYSGTLAPQSLDIVKNISMVRAAVNRLRVAGMFTGVLIEPEAAQIEAAHSIGAQQVTFCTTQYADLTERPRLGHTETSVRIAHELRRLREAATLAGQYGLRVAAGSGLTLRNITGTAEIHEISEIVVGHSIIARAIFVGLESAVREMAKAIRQAE